MGERDERTDRFFDKLHGPLWNVRFVPKFGRVECALGKRATAEGLEAAGDNVELHGGARCEAIATNADTPIADGGPCARFLRLDSLPAPLPLLETDDLTPNQPPSLKFLPAATA